MRKTAALCCILVGVSLTAGSREGLAVSVCYEGFADRILRIDVKRDGVLTTGAERARFGEGHPIQRTFSVKGKAIVDDEEAGFIQATIDGTVVLAPGLGAQMGLTWLERNVFIEFQGFLLACSSGVDASSATPDTWSCQGTSFFQESIGTISLQLTRIDPLSNELCSRFSLTAFD